MKKWLRTTILPEVILLATQSFPLVPAALCLDALAASQQGCAAFASLFNKTPDIRYVHSLPCHSS